ncbi:30S ribosomal protein S15 [Thalassoroseus pseudoceratinae]|uniref:30S ribosomal protein S15 n=1 Tax=Thalassoroseus pseudoceratinae TaxID=2713176 RepID=UPI001421E570|nr:30S ribosomal protein S15 [Thalassoroseus pseudoceratinae]
MSVTKERKSEIVEEYRRSDNDVGSPEVQIAVATERIANLTTHLRENPKDYASQRGLMQLVSRRKKLLRYLADNTPERYREILKRLNLRK